MNATRDDSGWPSSLSTRLRHESRSTRPAFSEVFQDCLMERITSDQALLPSRDRSELEGSLMQRGRFAMPIAAAVGLAAVMIVLGPGRVSKVVPTATVSIERADQRSLDVLPDAGIESLPLYDDIDAGMRAGVWMLASSIVEMPDWATLADFDAVVEPRDHPGP